MNHLLEKKKTRKSVICVNVCVSVYVCVCLHVWANACVCPCACACMCVFDYTMPTHTKMENSSSHGRTRIIGDKSVP